MCRARVWMRRSSNNFMPSTSEPLLVYDGNCGFCSRAVLFILRHERRQELRFVPRDSPRGQRLRRTHCFEAVESMLWIADGHAFTESDAVLQAASYLSGFWSPMAKVGWIVPAALRNSVYRFIARNRRRLFTRSPSCLLPSTNQRSRFLS